MNFNVATNSLDQFIATFQKSYHNTIKKLVLHNSGTAGSLISFNQFLNGQIADDESLS